MNQDQDQDQGEQLADVEVDAWDQICWWTAWNAAWEAMEARGSVGPIFGLDYRVLAGTAIQRGIGCSQTDLRNWILSAALTAAPESITHRSLRLRDQKRLQRERDNRESRPTGRA